jgi:hypothetical protein
LSSVTAPLYAELWISLASLLRSYTAAHGLNRKEQAMVELGQEHIVVRIGERWLRIDRSESEVIWARENGNQGRMQFTIEGRLKTQVGKEDHTEEEMDMQAEAWARELMQ